MAVTLRFLGTGTSQGIPVLTCSCPVCTSVDTRDQRLRTSAQLRIGDTCLVIDTGPDFRAQMLAAQTARVDAVLFTHEHKDHTAGLDDIRPFNFRYNMDMPVYAQPRVQEILRMNYPYIFEANYPGVPRILMHTLAPHQQFQIGEAHVQTLHVLHGKLPIMGFRIENLVYITDMKTLAADQWQYLQNVDTLIVNALQQTPHHSHLTLEEALAFIQQVNPRVAYLTHLSHTMGTHQAVQALLPPRVFVAYDGLEIVSQA